MAVAAGEGPPAVFVPMDRGVQFGRIDQHRKQIPIGKGELRTGLSVAGKTVLLIDFVAEQAAIYNRGETLPIGRFMASQAAVELLLFIPIVDGLHVVRPMTICTEDLVPGWQRFMAGQMAVDVAAGAGRTVFHLVLAQRFSADPFMGLAIGVPFMAAGAGQRFGGRTVGRAVEKRKIDPGR